MFSSGPRWMVWTGTLYMYMHTHWFRRVPSLLWAQGVQELHALEREEGQDLRRSFDHVLPGTRANGQAGLHPAPGKPASTTPLRHRADALTGV